MEKYTVSKRTINGKTFSTYSYRFTEEERKRLKKTLEKYQEDKVELFINGIELACKWERYFRSQRDVTFQRAEKKRMLRRFEKTSEELFAFIDGKLTAEEKKSVFDIGAVCDVEVCERERLHWLMISAASQLQEVCRIIKEDHSEPGRPSAEKATGELVKLIAHAFQTHFEKPTYQSGPFFSMIQIVFESCQLLFQDPSRHIKAALKTLP